MKSIQVYEGDGVKRAFKGRFGAAWYNPVSMAWPDPTAEVSNQGFTWFDDIDDAISELARNAHITTGAPLTAANTAKYFHKQAAYWWGTDDGKTHGSKVAFSYQTLADHVVVLRIDNQW